MERPLQARTVPKGIMFFILTGASTGGFERALVSGDTHNPVGRVAIVGDGLGHSSSPTRWRTATVAAVLCSFGVLARRAKLRNRRPAILCGLGNALSTTHGQVSAPWMTKVLSVLDLLWAVAVGASVTLRLFCSVRLTHSTGLGPLAASCYVTMVSLFISAAFLVPSASWKAVPRTSGPWLAGICTLPAFLLTMAASVLGLGIVQMVLRLATLSAALSLDIWAGMRGDGLQRRLIGTVIVFLGAVAGIFSTMGGTGSLVSLGMTLACLMSTFLAGACYVFQARLMAPTKNAEKGNAATDALACQLTNAVAQMLLLFPLLGCDAGATMGHFWPSSSDLPLWMFAGIQGVFYLRSLQVLPTRLGYATTFALSLWGQLATAAVFDVFNLGAHAAAPGRLLGLGLVVLGAAISATGGTGMPSKEPVQKQEVTVCAR